MDKAEKVTEPMISEVVDVEEYAKIGKEVPKGKKYIIKVDKEKYEVETSEMTGMQILTLAGKNPPDRFQLNQKFKGGRVEPVSLDQEVDFTAPGVERFMTIALDQNEG